MTPIRDWRDFAFRSAVIVVFVGFGGVSLVALWLFGVPLFKMAPTEVKYAVIGAAIGILLGRSTK